MRISGSTVVLPNHVKVPTLMSEFILNVFKTKKDIHPVELAISAHYELVTIHPFVDGNGRTARLLMNLVLMQNGYPPAIIKIRERERYINSLQKAQLGGSREDFDKLIAKAVERSLDIYLKAVKGEETPKPTSKQSLLKIGELAKLTGQSVPTIRYWVSQGLLEVASKTAKGYSLFDKNQIKRVHKILDLKAERRTLGEIWELLKNSK